MISFAGKSANQRKNELVERCDALYIWHKEPLYRLALAALGGDKEWALSVLDDCMMTAYRYISLFDDVKSEKSKAIMIAILHSKLNLIYRDMWAKMGAALDEEKTFYTKKDQLFADQVLVRNELSADLARYMERLSRKEKELVFFRFFAGFKDAEVQEYFGMSANELQTRLYAIKRKISNMIIEG